jgi:uncharacterized protein YjbI with pentapeptide repeats
MRWLKGNQRKTYIGIVGLVLLLTLLMVVIALVGHQTALPGQATGTGMVQATPTMNPTVVAALTAKENLRKLEFENDRSFTAWFWNSSFGPIVAALVAVVGVFTTVWVNFRQWLGNQTVAQKKDENDRTREREKRDEERFQKVIEGLGSERTEAQVGAAIMLRTFLQPGYERFYGQAFDLAVAHLRLRNFNLASPEPLNSLSQALITVFKESFPRAREWLKQDPQILDASQVRLDNAHLVKADLRQAWMPEAVLRSANLSGANLSKANLTETRLHRAILCGAILEKTDLNHADLTHADLREANLHETILSGANLEAAILENTDLRNMDLSGLRLYWIRLENAKLNNANLSSSNLQIAVLSQAGLSGANLSGANLSGAILQRADLSGANLSESNLSGAILQRADLSGGYCQLGNRAEQYVRIAS